MKKIIRLLSKLFMFLILLGLHSCGSYTNYISYNIDGYWSQWKELRDHGSYSDYQCRLYGNYGGFQIYNYNKNPWDYFFKFEITAFSKPTKEEIKAHYKNGQWYEYYGIVEYFVSEDYPTIESSLRTGRFVGEDFTYGKKVKRSTVAKIRIAPYKTHPEVYNILFDDVGVAIQIYKCWDW